LLKLLIFTGIENYVTAREGRDFTDISLRTGATSTFDIYEGWNFNSGNYLFTTDTK